MEYKWNSKLLGLKGTQNTECLEEEQTQAAD